MIIIMKPNTSGEAVKKVTNLIGSRGLTAHLLRGPQVTIVGMIDDKAKLLDTNAEIGEGVDKVMAATESYRLVNKKFCSEDPVIPVGSTHIGPGTMTVIAGLCAIESLDQLLETAYVVKRAGATFLRGGAYKPRTPPYSFQGPEEEELKHMRAVRGATGLNVIYEAINTHAIESAMKRVNMLQIGARSMQNFELLKETGKSGTSVLLKRGLCATTDEWLNAAEYIVSESNSNIVLCERGIRTYEASTRNTLNISAAPVIRQKDHLPIIVNPSHATGIRTYVEPLTRAATAVRMDGLMIEAHPCPAKTLSDDPQSPTFSAFEQLMKDLASYAELLGRTSKVQ